MDQTEAATALANEIEDCGGEAGVLMLLDCLATAGLKLEASTAGEASKAYFVGILDAAKQ
jgi:hypothetical protein